MNTLQKTARPAQKPNQTIQGILTSKIETKSKENQAYYYGFFQLIPTDCPECGDGSGKIKIGSQIRSCKICYLPKEDIPVIFKTKPNLTKGSQVELAGTWANSPKDRPSFTCYKYFLLKEPSPPTLHSLQETLRPLLNTSLEKKQEWTQRTDFLFKKQKDLQEIEKVAKLGSQYLQAYLLTKQAFYANYQAEHLEQANFSLETYFQRIGSEIEREISHIKAYQAKEKVNQILDQVANNAIQITLQALEEKDKIIQDLEQKLVNCKCQEVKNA